MVFLINFFTRMFKKINNMPITSEKIKLKIIKIFGIDECYLFHIILCYSNKN